MTATLLTLLETATTVATVLVFARILLSFLPGVAPEGLRRFVLDVTEPVLGPIRRALPPMGGLDLSPMIVMIGIGVLEQVLRTLIITAR